MALQSSRTCAKVRWFTLAVTGATELIPNTTPARGAKDKCAQLCRTKRGEILLAEEQDEPIPRSCPPAETAAERAAWWSKDKSTA